MCFFNIREMNKQRIIKRLIVILKRRFNDDDFSIKNENEKDSLLKTFTEEQKQYFEIYENAISEIEANRYIWIYNTAYHDAIKDSLILLLGILILKTWSKLKSIGTV